jgi:clan AA aspartic protease (TIGR02281 family)
MRVASVLLILFLVSINAAWADTYQQAVQLYNQQKFRQAVQLFDQSARSQANPAASYYYQALCYQQLGDFARAKQLYRYVADNFPGTQEGRLAAEGLTGLDPTASKVNVMTAASSSSAAVAPLAGARTSRSSYKISDTEWKKLPSTCSVPFRQGLDGHVHVAAQIDGRSVDAVFDTGAESCVIGENHLLQIGHPIPTTGVATGVRGVGGVTSALETMSTITLGPITRTIPILVLKQLGAPPLIGQTFFKGYQYVIDNSAGLIRFYRAGAEQRDVPFDTVSVPYTPAGNNMLVDVQINGRQTKMCFDTGCAGDLVLAPNQLRELGLSVPANARMSGSSGVSGSANTVVFNVDNVRLGPISKTDVQVSVLLQPLSYGLIGQSFFGDRHYTIDNEQHVIKFWH